MFSIIYFHTAIFVGGFLLLLSIIILRAFLKYTAIIAIKSCFSCCCRGRKYAYLLVASDDFYSELSFLQLYKEFKKSKIEEREYIDSYKKNAFKQENFPQLNTYMVKLTQKINIILNRFEDYFKGYGIQGENNLKEKIEMLLKI